jgi:HEAT repeat protein
MFYRHVNLLVAVFAVMTHASAVLAQLGMGDGVSGNQQPFNAQFAAQCLESDDYWGNGLDMLEKHGDEEVLMKAVIAALRKDAQKPNGKVTTRVEALVSRLAQIDNPQVAQAFKMYASSNNRALAALAKTFLNGKPKPDKPPDGPGKARQPPDKKRASDSGKDTRAIPVSPSVGATNAAEVLVSPRGAWAWSAFAELEHKGGPKVCSLGVIGFLLVPSNLRFRPVAGRPLVEAVAATRGFKTLWLRDGQYVIIYAGAEYEADLQRIEKDLSSTNASVRLNAVWDGLRTWDMRAVPWLAKAARDENADVAREAWTGLDAFGWESVFLLLNDEALPLAATRLQTGDSTNRCAVVYGLGFGGERAIPLLEEATADSQMAVRAAAVMALGRIGGERALAILRKALGDSEIRLFAVAAMGNTGDESVLPILGQLLRDREGNMRCTAAMILGLDLGGERAAEILENIVDPSIQIAARFALAYAVHGEKRLRLLDQALADKNESARWSAAYALGDLWDDCPPGGRSYAHGGATGVTDRNRVLALARKATQDTSEGVRIASAEALGRIGGDEALALLKDLFAKDAKEEVRGAAARSLGHLGDKHATAFMIDALAHSRDRDSHRIGYGLALADDDDADAAMFKFTRKLGRSECGLYGFGHGSTFGLGGGGGGGGSGNGGCGWGGGWDEGGGGGWHGWNSRWGPGWGSCNYVVRWGGSGSDGSLGGGGFGYGGANGCFGGSGLSRKEKTKLRAFLERDEAHRDWIVRRLVIDGYGEVGGEKALAFLGAALRDKDAGLRVAAARALIRMGGARARNLILGRLPVEKDYQVLTVIEPLSRQWSKR